MTAICQHCLNPIHLDNDPRLANPEWRHTGKPRPHRPEPVEELIRTEPATAELTQR